MNSPLVWSICGLLVGGAWGWTDRMPAAKNTTGPHLSKTEKGNPSPAPVPLTDAALDGPGGTQLRLLARIGSASRADMVALSQELFSGKPDPYTVSLLWERWLELDPEGGFHALLAGELTGEDRMTQVWGYLGKWAVKDPDTAIARALALPEKYDQTVAFSRIVNALVTTRPADFFQHYAELSKLGAAQHCVGAAASHLAATDPRALVKLLEYPAGFGMGDPEQPKAWQGLASGWARIDPRAALDFFRKVADPENRNLGLNKIAQQVITRDPDLAAVICKEAGGKESIQKAAEALALTNPDAALAWLKKYFPGESASAASVVARNHIPRTAGSAVDFMVRHAEVLFSQGKVAMEPLSRWSVDDPAAALILTDKIGDAGVRANARELLLDLMVVSSPQEAIQAAAAGPERVRTFRGAVENWAKQDLTAASRWLNDLPAGAERDSAISGLLSVTLRVEPDSALPWAITVSDKSERVDNLAWVLRRTGRQTEGVVVPILQELAIPPEEISEVLNGLKSVDPFK